MHVNTKGAENCFFFNGHIVRLHTDANARKKFVVMGWEKYRRHLTQPEGCFLLSEWLFTSTRTSNLMSPFHCVQIGSGSRPAS
jgi:hypothetical protein